MQRHIVSLTLFFLLILGIGIANYIPHTFLTGWDNLHPEFNLQLNISRSLFAVWQEYQGVGLVGGMGHAADLIHQLELLLFSAVLPASFLRFFYTFLMLFIGTTGMYAFVYTLTNKRSIAFLGGLFYLCNLVTVQLFYVPLEVFTTEFGFLPWMLTGVWLYLTSPHKKHFLLLCLIFLLATPVGYVQTVFAVCTLALAVVTAMRLMFYPTIKDLKHAGIVFVLLFLVNAFWLLPSGYFLLTNASTPTQAKINQMTTESIFLQNREFGFLPDVMLLKGYLFNDVDPGLTGNTLMMAPWRTWLSLPITLIGFLLFGVIIYGAVAAWKKHTPLSLVCLLLFCISFSALATATPPFSWVDDMLRTHFPLLNQAYRFPFTKFGILAGFSYATLFAIGIERLTATKPLFHKSLMFFVPLLLGLFVFPVYTGNLFYAKERLVIPQEYFRLFAFFSHQNPNTRIANFPQYTYWSWGFYRWGYSGSGFPWYGIAQPILDRSFDPWSFYNENYYWELSQAVFSQNPTRIAAVLNKYQISWLVVDKNEYNPQYPQLFLNPNLDTLLSHIASVHKTQTFGNITVYAVSLHHPPNNFVFLSGPLPHTNAEHVLTNDSFYTTYGTYIADTTSTQSTRWYPFRDLSSVKQRSPAPFSISESGSQLIFSAEIPDSLNNATLTIPNQPTTLPHFSLTVMTPVSLSSFTLPSVATPPEILTGTHPAQLAIAVQKITKQYLSASITPTITNTPAINCDTIRTHGTVSVAKNNDMLRLSSYNESLCATYPANFLSHSLGYVVKIPVTHVHGQGLHVWISDDKENFTLIDTYLPENNHQNAYTFILPPLEPFSTSYAIRVANISFGNEPTVNDIGTIHLYPIPYDFLQSIYFSSGTTPSATDSTIPLTVVHPTPNRYELSMQPTALVLHPVIVLSQGFDTGWKAYALPKDNAVARLFPFVFGTQLTNHVLINNWENGWITTAQDAPQRIILLFLPQYLEYLGFVLLFASPLLLFLSS